MSKYELWVMVEGEDRDMAERKVAETDSLDDIYKAVDDCSDEVENDLSKYFELITEHTSYIFGSMYDFDHTVMMYLN